MSPSQRSLPKPLNLKYHLQTYYHSASQTLTCVEILERLSREVLLKCRFKYSRSGMLPELLHFNELIGDMLAIQDHTGSSSISMCLISFKSWFPDFLHSAYHNMKLSCKLFLVFSQTHKPSPLEYEFHEIRYVFLSLYYCISRTWHIAIAYQIWMNEWPGVWPSSSGLHLSHTLLLLLLLSCFSHVQLFATLWTIVHQTPLSMGFSKQEHWSRLHCPPPGYLPDPGIKPVSLKSPALAGRFLTTSTTWEAPPTL